jgi:PAS domain S-box-containing protein
VYTLSELPGIYQDAEEGACSFVILPANSPAHTEFALNAPGYPGFALHPLAGWIAGIDLAMSGQSTPKIFCGGPQPLGNAAAVMRVKLPADRLAQINIINLFQPGQGDKICFPATGFSATTAVINDQERNFAEYLQQIRADTRLPLVANYCGAMVNVSLKSVDAQQERVEFFAPVVSGIEYRLALPVTDYVSEFEARLKDLSPGNVLFSCNCILNYVHSKLAGNRTGAFVGPVTFGEIAFQLLNQTLVYVEIVNVTFPGSQQPIAEAQATSLELSAAHEEIQASERRFRGLSESAPLGIFLTDEAGRVIYENRYCQKFNLDPLAHAEAGAWMRNIHPKDLPRFISALKDSEPKDFDSEHEFRIVGPSGKVCWIQSRSTLLRSESGGITGRVGTLQDITGRREAETRLELVNQELMQASHEAGFAEFANGVLHNVKNVVNSINVSASVISNGLHKSRITALTKVSELIREHAGDLGSFMTVHPRGKLLPGFIERLDGVLAAERAALLGELKALEASVQHIKAIVTTQQDFAKPGAADEKIDPVELMEDSLRITAAAFAHQGIQVVREYEASLPEITVEKHKVLQILVNFIRNAKEACQAADRPDRKVVLQLANGGEHVRFAIRDNGIGIAPEILGRLFEHGFTTKKDGHGFGLHSAFLAVRQLGGDMQVQSDGVGTGATFSLKLPLCGPAFKTRGNGAGLR